MIDEARDLQRHQRARDPDRLLAGLGLEEGLELGVVLHGPDAGVAERELEIAVPGFTAGAMPGPAGRVVGARDEAAVGEELARRGEARDAVDLRIDGEGVHLAEPGDPEQPLDIGVGNQ